MLIASTEEPYVPSLAIQSAPDEFSLDSRPGILLAKLREAHEQLAREMDNLGRITAGPLPEGPDFSTARWRLSRASLRRRTLSARIAEILSARAEDGDARCLNMLRSENQIAVARSTRHVHDWTAQSISKDWTGYCLASREIRTQMKANILLEQHMLYPLLERLALVGD